MIHKLRESQKRATVCKARRALMPALHLAACKKHTKARPTSSTVWFGGLIPQPDSCSLSESSVVIVWTQPYPPFVGRYFLSPSPIASRSSCSSPLQILQDALQPSERRSSCFELFHFLVLTCVNSQKQENLRFLVHFHGTLSHLSILLPVNLYLFT